MLLSEVTVQEQGVEMYEMFRKQLYIEKNMKYLDSAMNNLRDVADNTNARLERESDAENARLEKESDKKEERKFNMLGILFGLMFITEPIANILRGFIDWIIGLFGLGPTDSDLAVGIIWFILASIGFLMIDKHYELLLFRKKTR